MISLPNLVCLGAQKLGLKRVLLNNNIKTTYMGIKSPDNTDASDGTEIEEAKSPEDSREQAVRECIQAFRSGRRNHGPYEPSHYWMEGYPLKF
ncbi:MAG: hypothetical protein V1760_02655 [Candidatus Peregrinibacteria bacterium]